MPKHIKTAVSTFGAVVPFTVRLIVLGSLSILSPKSVYFILFLKLFPGHFIFISIFCVSCIGDSMG